MVQADGTASGPFRFSGQWGGYQDVETGLVLMGWRYYDPGTGRFLTKDPIGFAGGINQYAYAGNDPVNFVDPYGLFRIGPLDIPNGTVAGAVLTGGVILAGGPATWAVAGGFALGTLVSRYADGNSWSTATAHGAMGAVAGAEIAAIAPALATGWGLANPANRSSSACTVPQGLYRRGNFADPGTGWDGNNIKGYQWAPENPLSTPNFGDKYGLPGGNMSPQPDWVINGRLLPGAYYTTGPAPGIPGGGRGGAMEIRTPDPSLVILDWFHMP